MDLSTVLNQVALNPNINDDERRSMIAEILNNNTNQPVQPELRSGSPVGNQIYKDPAIDTSFLDETKWNPVGVQGTQPNRAEAEKRYIDENYTVSNNNGTTTNVVTGETGVETQPPKAKVDNEINEVLNSGDEYDLLEFTNSYLNKNGDTSGQFDYQLMDDSSAWKAPLVSLLSTGLTAALGGKAGMDERQVAVMMADGIRRSGMDYKKNRDRIGRQANIEALEAKGYLQEDILKWLDTGDSKSLIEVLKNRPHANSKSNQSNYYSKGDVLPDGKTVPKDGTYTIHYTYSKAGVPEVAHISYDGNLEGKKLDNDYAIEKLKHGNKQREAQAEEAAEIDNAIRLSEETLEAVNQAILTGDAASGDHTGKIDQYTPTFFADTQQADAAYNRALNLLTINNLDLMKGVLTDRDVEILRGAATSLDKGNYWSVNRTELQRIKAKIAQSIADARQGTSPAQRSGAVNAESDMTRGNDGNLYQFRNGEWYQVQE